MIYPEIMLVRSLENTIKKLREENENLRQNYTRKAIYDVLLEEAEKEKARKVKERAYSIISEWAIGKNIEDADFQDLVNKILTIG